MRLNCTPSEREVHARVCVRAFDAKCVGVVWMCVCERAKLMEIKRRALLWWPMTQAHNAQHNNRFCWTKNECQFSDADAFVLLISMTNYKWCDCMMRSWNNKYANMRKTKRKNFTRTVPVEMRSSRLLIYFIFLFVLYCFLSITKRAQLDTLSVFRFHEFLFLYFFSIYHCFVCLVGAFMDYYYVSI